MAEADVCVALAVALPNVVGTVGAAIVVFPTTTTEVRILADGDGVEVTDAMVETVLMVVAWEAAEEAVELDEGDEDDDGREEAEEDADVTGLGFEMPN